MRGEVIGRIADCGLNVRVLRAEPCAACCVLNYVLRTACCVLNYLPRAAYGSVTKLLMTGDVNSLHAKLWLARS